MKPDILLLGKALAGGLYPVNSCFMHCRIVNSLYSCSQEIDSMDHASIIQSTVPQGRNQTFSSGGRDAEGVEFEAPRSEMPKASMGWGMGLSLIHI